MEESVNELVDINNSPECRNPVALNAVFADVVSSRFPLNSWRLH